MVLHPCFPLTFVLYYITEIPPSREKTSIAYIGMVQLRHMLAECVGEE